MLDAFAHTVVYGGILMLLWVLLGAVLGATAAVATRVFQWMI